MEPRTDHSFVFHCWSLELSPNQAYEHTPYKYICVDTIPAGALHTIPFRGKCAAPIATRHHPLHLTL